MKSNTKLKQRTLQSLLKNGAFLLVIMMVVFACSNKAEEEVISTNETVANLTAKIDGAIMGSVIAPNANIEIVATSGDKKITGTTDAKGDFFITGFNEGIYDVTIKTATARDVTTFQDVKVQIGEVTALGTVTLEK